MGQIIRSARGEAIDFELLAIKAQLASVQVPKIVEQRKQAIDEKDGVRTAVQPDIDFMAASVEAASSSAAQKQLKRK